MNATTQQIVTAEFAAWLAAPGSIFHGVVDTGDQWDTDEAWDDSNALFAARKCYNHFHAGELDDARDMLAMAQRIIGA